MKKILVMAWLLITLSVGVNAAEFSWDVLWKDMIPLVGVTEHMLGEGENKPLFFYEPGRGITVIQEVDTFTQDVAFTVGVIFERYLAHSASSASSEDYITFVVLGKQDHACAIFKVKNVDLQTYAKSAITINEMRKRTIFIYNGVRN